MTRFPAALLLIAIATTGCGSAPDASESAISSTSEALDLQTSTALVWRLPGTSLELVGRDLNGRKLNGSALDGRRLEAVRLDSATMNGEAATASLIDSELHVTDSIGRHLRADRVIGLVLAGKVDDGTELALRIDGVEPSYQALSGVDRYIVSYATAQGSNPLCGIGSDGEPVRALAMQGRWDYREGVEGGGSHIDDPGVITFACEGFIIAKCVNMGFAPWRPALACSKGAGCERTTLADAHQACTRMLRADYCGDGVSHTQDGVLINAYDAIGLRVDSADWPVEAEWQPSGARCANVARLPSQPLPGCAGTLGAVPDCGTADHFATGTLIISEVQP